LLEYEVWNHARGLARSHGDETRAVVGRLALVELDPRSWFLSHFPMPVRTLDALHLASIEFLRSRGQMIELFGYDERLLAVARALQIPLYEP
jgi:hypothetical protein